MRAQTTFALLGGSLLLIILAFVLHGRAAFIDAPIFHVAGLGVSSFELVLAFAFPVFFFVVRGVIDAVHNFTAASWPLMAVEAVIVVLGIVGLFEVLAHAAGVDIDPVGSFGDAWNQIFQGR